MTENGRSVETGNERCLRIFLNIFRALPLQSHSYMYAIMQITVHKWRADYTSKGIEGQRLFLSSLNRDTSNHSLLFWNAVFDQEFDGFIKG